ncbi:MAG TPA: hypothetical protein VF099_10410 [Ktedonobacterales bacterium]
MRSAAVPAATGTRADKPALCTAVPQASAGRRDGGATPETLSPRV